MKMIKKVTSIIVGITLVLSVAGCSKETTEKNGADSGVEQSNDLSSKTGETGESIQGEDKEVSTNDGKNEKPATDGKDKVVTNKPTTPSGTTNNNLNSKPSKPKGNTNGNTTTTKPIKPEVPSTDPSDKEDEDTVQKPEEVKISTKNIADKILGEVKFGGMGEMRSEMSDISYPFDKSIVEEYVIYQAMMNINSDEVAIFKVKDKADIPKIEEAIGNRLNELEKIWSQYLPKQHEKVKNYIIVKKGNYIMFSISAYQDRVEEIFNEMI
jgi:hypothetical protein